MAEVEPSVALQHLTDPAGLVDFAMADNKVPVPLRQVSAVWVDADLEPEERRRAIVRALQRLLTGMAGEPYRLVIRLSSAGDGRVRLEMGAAHRQAGAGILPPAMEGFLGRIVWSDAEPASLRSGTVPM